MIVPSHETDAAPPERGCKGLVFLAGAIKYWWLTKCGNCGHVGAEGLPAYSECPMCSANAMLELWGGPEHTEYVQWRNFVRKGLIKAGYLTYAPHEAFKGTWDERAQSVNDAGIAASHMMLVLSPPGIPTDGTDSEVAYAERVGTPVIYAPPGTTVVELLKSIEGVMRHGV